MPCQDKSKRGPRPPTLALGSLLLLILLFAAACGNPPSATGPSASGTTSTTATVSALPAIGVGAAHGVDPAGDISAPDGTTVSNGQMPDAPDLVSADLSADGTALAIRLTTAGPIPTKSLVDASGYVAPGKVAFVYFGVVLKGADGNSQVLSIGLVKNWRVNRRDGATRTDLSVVTSVTGNTTTLIVPLGSLPGLTSSFKWSVGSGCVIRGTGDPSSDSTYGDSMPGNPRGPKQYLDFPTPSA